MSNDYNRTERSPFSSPWQPIKDSNVTGKSQGKVLAAFALPEEVVPLTIPGFEVIPVLTRITKPFAAATLAKAIVTHNPTAIINIGTAGTQKYHIGDIIVSTHFVDRDIRRQQFTSVPSEIRTSPMFTDYLKSVIDGKPCDGDFIVNTGDDFVTASDVVEGDVVEMEGFADAVVAQTFGIPFVAVKYVTDVLGQNSMEAWESRLADARRDLTAYFEAVEW